MSPYKLANAVYKSLQGNDYILKNYSTDKQEEFTKFREFLKDYAKNE